MNFDKLFEEFIDEVQREGTYASLDEVRIATKEMLDVIKNNKDATPEELVDFIIKNNLEQIENIKKNIIFLDILLILTYQILMLNLWVEM